MLRVLALLAAASRRAAAAELSGGDEGGSGNAMCWYSPNWLDIDISYEKCCGSAADADACFAALGGWYSFEICCFPLAPGCDWEAVFANLGLAPGEVDADSLQKFQEFPMLICEFCCVFPGDGRSLHPCWNPTGEGSVWPGVDFDRCCHPVLPRLLRRPVDAPWLELELGRELRPLQGRRWSAADLSAFDARLDAASEGHEGAGNRPCRLRIRGGSQVSLCDLAKSCPPLNIEDATNDCSFVVALQRALEIIGRLRPLPDVDLMVSGHNQDLDDVEVPVFTTHRPKDPRSFYVLLPMEWQMHPAQNKNYVLVRKNGGAFSVGCSNPEVDLAWDELELLGQLLASGSLSWCGFVAVLLEFLRLCCHVEFQ